MTRRKTDPLEGLRDFQQDTARYVFDRMFGDGPDATTRFLVADEVGLGKTLVARGVIAQTIEHLKAAGDKRIDIVYLASNSAIAAQNVRKLAPRGVETIRRTERLSLLPYVIGNVTTRDVNLIALTPATSVDMRSSNGMFPERAAAFAALRSIWSGHRLRGAGIARIFAGSIGPYGGRSPIERLRYRADDFGTLPRKTRVIFARAIRGVDVKRRREKLLGLDDELHELAPYYASGRRVPPTIAKRRARLIREVREAMALTGVQLLRPDLVILDEFQRFRTLIDVSSDEPISEVAHALFTYTDPKFQRTARVLLLSATPYVLHTTRAEAASGADTHYDDFLMTYRFLAGGLPKTDTAEAERLLGERLRRVRSAVLDAEMAGTRPVREAVDAVSDQLRQVMVRTERLASTADHNGMLLEVPDRIAVPSSQALTQYVGAARVAQHLRERRAVTSDDVMDYWKSAPYTLSFLGGHAYLLSKAMRDRVGRSQAGQEFLSLVTNSGAVLPWSRIVDYKPIDPANGRLERLWSDFFDAGAHRLLWLPPCSPYYSTSGPFDDPAARRLTKRLVFSAWTLVPTVVSTLTTFEVERRLTDEAKAVRASTSRYDEEASRRHTRHLRFGSGLRSLWMLAFLIPSPALARLADPLQLCARLRSRNGVPTWRKMREEARKQITAALEPHVPQERGREAGSAGWYALAPLLLDAANSASTGFDPSALSAVGLDVDDPGSGAATRYFDAVGRWLNGSAASRPAVPDDLEKVLALAALAGPAACLFRSLSRHFPDATDSELVSQTMRASAAMVSLFNSWEATRIIDSAGRSKDFWRRLLDYCAEGHLQAVLDEYVAALVEWRGHDREADRTKALKETVDDLSTVFKLHTSSYDVMRTDDGSLVTEKMRARFAVRFGDARSEADEEQRADSVSLAFNSPFWPFVLTSTSIGQEGLDFHLYCHAVTHWNLPSNPVDLEQREGRVHRYKGHAIRKNVAKVVGPPSGGTEPWAELFARADARTAGGRESQVIPYWVFAPDELPEHERAYIERHLPITPYSREASRRDPLLASLAYYRLAFGQPRQEELVRHVLDAIDDDVLRADLAEIRVDLSPPRKTPGAPGGLG